MKSWRDLKKICPLDISRIDYYYKELDAFLPKDLDSDNLAEYKENVLRARTALNSMFTVLIQMLYDKEILRKAEDKILYNWLTEDTSRYLGILDKEEEELIIRLDGTDRVGVARISAYSKQLETAGNIIYETLLKASNEYNKIADENREKRAFLYILFQILQVTMSISGGLQREGTNKMNKRTALSSFPIDYRAMMTEKGGEIIKKGYEEQTGIKVSDIENSLEELYDEFDEEEKDD